MASDRNHDKPKDTKETRSVKDEPDAARDAKAEREARDAEDAKAARKIKDDDKDHGRHATQSGAAIVPDAIRRSQEVNPQDGVTPVITAGTWPTPIDGFRAAVSGVPVTVVNAGVGDALLPYPTGTPLAPGSAFWLEYGFYKSATPT